MLFKNMGHTHVNMQKAKRVMMYITKEIEFDDYMLFRMRTHQTRCNRSSRASLN